MNSLTRRSRFVLLCLGHMFFGLAFLSTAACGPDLPGTPEDTLNGEQAMGTFRYPGAPNMVITGALAESQSTISAGQTLWASITYTNEGGAAEGIQAFGITSLSPSSSPTSGPWKTLSPELGVSTVQPGGRIGLAASVAFTSADELGTWRLYATFEDSSGTWHDSNIIYFNVVAPGGSGASTTTTTGAAASSTTGAHTSTTTTSGTTTAGGGSGASTTTTSGGSGSSTTTTGGGSGSSGGQQSWVWVFTNWSTALTDIGNNKGSFTHVSPTTYEINYDYVSGVPEFAFGNVDNFGGLTSAGICQQVHAAGLKCVPLIYGGANNSGTDQGVQNILNNTSGAQTAFIDALVTEGKAKSYDGWNLDWEVSSSTNYASYGTKLISFLSALRQQLNANGMTLSIDIINNMMKQTWCSGGGGLIDLTQIGAVVDSVIDEDYQAPYWSGSGAAPTSCPATMPNPATCVEDVVTDLELLCTYVRPLSVVNVGLLAPTQNAVAGESFTAIEGFGFHAVAVWPNDTPFLETSSFSPSGSTWYSELASFMAK